jgi:predicted metal-dependent HD superfamily phosphohydrolase
MDRRTGKRLGVRAARDDATPLTRDAALVVDVDLAILGASAERFDEYERQVREEYPGCQSSCFAASDGRFSRGS